MNSFYLITVLGLIMCLNVDARMFTDTQGRQIDAEVIEVLDDSVKLQIKGNAKIHSIPFSKLSEGDVLYLKSLSEDPVEKEVAKKTKKSKLHKNSAAKAMEDYGLKNNFDAPWPSLISVDINPEISTVIEDSEEKIFIYHSPNYEFKCDVRLSANVIKKFAVMFEATREFCRLLPISSMKAHVPGAQFRNKILLFETKEAFIANGGPPNSAGVFKSSGDGNVIMVPLTSLGVKKVGSSYMYDHGESNKTLVHEIVHQLTDREYYAHGSRGWFTEGLAEYCGVSPYRSGKFLLKTNLSYIEDYAVAYGKDGNGGRNLGEEFSAPDLKSYMLMPYSDFTANGNFNYGLGLLITTYFFHMEEDRSNIINFLKAIKEGKEGEEALASLLNGRSFDELEQQIYKAWKSKGVKINFN